MPIKLKPEYENEVVGFGRSGLPLGQRNDLHELVRLGKTRNKRLLRFFEEPIPDDDELDKLAAEEFDTKQKAKASRIAAQAKQPNKDETLAGEAPINK